VPFEKIRRIKMAGIGFGAQGSTYTVQASNGLGGRTLIVSVAKTGGVTAANLATIIKYMTTSHGVSGSGDSAFSVAGISGVVGTDATIYVALQGTGDLTVADADCGISGYAVAVVATFDNNF
jgi:hypothetical protein